MALAKNEFAAAHNTSLVIAAFGAVISRNGLSRAVRRGRAVVRFMRLLEKQVNGSTEQGP